MSRKILVTSALPYSNGAIHLGHLVEYIQTDIWARYQKMSGNTCYYICADDNHGTPIMLRAHSEGISPEELIEKVHQDHVDDFSAFLIDFDHYYQTHSPETQELVNLFYQRLDAAGLIEIRSIEQFYDPVKEMFLPDRFIKGECPKCHAKDQYGDSCEACSATYRPTELIEPFSVITGAKPEMRQSDHFFYRLSDERCINFLKTWTRGRLQSEVINKIDEWLEEGLSDWDISRDAPYFGFEIPNHPGKYFYVWLDAPIGYMGSFKKFCNEQGIDFDAYWGTDSDAELYHFIGKDILYFHTLFWPSELHFAGFRVPTNVFCHGFLTVNGQKMSKSRGTFITAASYRKHLKNPEYLRYYYAAKLNASLEDIDLNFDDFTARINSDLVGKYVNIASRSAKFLATQFDNRLGDTLTDYPLINKFRQSADSIAKAYETREFSRAVREIMRLADLANQYIDAQKPWVIAKVEPKSAKLHGVCTMAINLFRLLTLYLKPILPATAERVEAFLAIAPLTWSDVETSLLDHPIGDYAHLVSRINPAAIEAMITENRETIASEQAESSTTPTKTDKPAAKNQEAAETTTITIDDFKKLDLRIAKVTHAEEVKDSDRLLRLTVDLGDSSRTIFSGVKPKITPDELIGKSVVVVANLAPRKMKFGVSEGMMLLAVSDEDDLVIVAAEDGAMPGMRVC
jgi:methionyl-tRNA synthetase